MPILPIAPFKAFRFIMSFGDLLSTETLLRLSESDFGAFLDRTLRLSGVTSFPDKSILLTHAHTANMRPLDERVGEFMQEQLDAERGKKWRRLHADVSGFRYAASVWLLGADGLRESASRRIDIKFSDIQWAPFALEATNESFAQDRLYLSDVTYEHCEDIPAHSF